MCDQIPSEKCAREMIGERPNTCHFTKVIRDDVYKHGGPRAPDFARISRQEIQGGPSGRGQPFDDIEI